MIGNRSSTRARHLDLKLDMHRDPDRQDVQTLPRVISDLAARFTPHPRPSERRRHRAPDFARRSRRVKTLVPAALAVIVAAPLAVSAASPTGGPLGALLGDRSDVNLAVAAPAGHAATSAAWLERRRTWRLTTKHGRATRSTRPTTRPATGKPRTTPAAPVAATTSTAIPPSASTPAHSLFHVLPSAPAQPALLVWGSSSGIGAYAKRGALVVAGRVNYADQSFKDISAAGGTVLVYLDAVIDASYGRYHQMLMQSSACGPAAGRWPGSPRANQWGYLSDFRPGSVIQEKLECVLETMVRENPHIAGFFADDLGSRSWFPDIDWSSWSSADKAAYRQGAIDLTATFRKVADRHGLIVIVNGTWNAGTSDGGGYPDANRAGNALVDGMMIEHHTVDSFWKSILTSSQWAAQSTVTRGRPLHLAVSMTDSATQDWAASGCVAYAVTQSDYGTKPAPWGPFYDLGLPDHVS